MAWSTPPTAVTGSIATAADFNVVRDDLNYLRGTDGLTLNVGTFCAENSTAAWKHLLNRQGGSTSNWQTQGTNNYVETAAFEQAGVARIAFSGHINNSVNVTLPIAVSSTNAAIVVTSVQPGHGMGGGIFNSEGYLTSPSLLQLWAYYIPGTFTSANVDVNWRLICK